MDDYGTGPFNILDFYRKKKKNRQRKQNITVPVVDLGFGDNRLPNDSHFDHHSDDHRLDAHQEVPPIDSYINIELEKPQPTENGGEYVMCRCHERPTTCICFKRPCIMHRNDGTKYKTYVSPPPSPILRHNIGFWSIGDDDYVYIKKDRDTIVKSRIKYSEYMFAHCHEPECLKIPYTEYDAFVHRDTPRSNFVSSYEEYMYPVEANGQSTAITTIVYPDAPVLYPSPPLYEDALEYPDEVVDGFASSPLDVDADTVPNYVSLSDPKYAPEA
jgi:hypothetical protein